MTAVEERWCIAIEGVVSADKRVLVELETTWKDPAPVIYQGRVVGKLADFKRVKPEEGKGWEIHATYSGPEIPEGHTLSGEMLQTQSIPENGLYWLKGLIAGVSIIRGETMFGDRIKRVETN